MAVETASERVDPVGNDDRLLAPLDTVIEEAFEPADPETKLGDFEAMLQSTLF
jgi:hypothetical protein